jgi:hypothetical protein
MADGAEQAGHHVEDLAELQRREAALVQRRMGADMAAGDGKHRRADVHTGHLEPLAQGAKVVAGAQATSSQVRAWGR